MYVVRENILELCERKGMTEKDLAKKSNLNMKRFLATINSEESANQEDLKAIARALGVALIALYKPTSNMTFQQKKVRIGNNIQVICLVKDIKQKEIAKKLGYSNSKISRAMMGNTSFCVLAEIAKKLNLKMKDLEEKDFEAEVSISLQNFRANVNNYVLKNNISMKTLSLIAMVSYSKLLSVMSGNCIGFYNVITKIAKALNTTTAALAAPPQ